MTDSEFVDYYNSYRDYTPGPNVQFESTVVLQKIDRERYEKSRKTAEPKGSAREDMRAQLKKEANVSRGAVGKTVTVNEDGVEKKISKTEDGYVIREKRQGVVDYKEQRPKPTVKERAKKLSDEWVPIEERKREKCVEGKKTKLPISIVLAIACITLSLMLIVGSSVILGSAKSEQGKINDEIARLKEENKLLSADLEKKNQDADIDSFATEVLGMISQEYVSVRYIKNENTDGLKVSGKTDSDLWSSIINAIFPFLN